MAKGLIVSLTRYSVSLREYALHKNPVVKRVCVAIGALPASVGDETFIKSQDQFL